MATPTPSGTHAVLAIDPGGTTGVAACYFPVRPTVKETLLAAYNKKSAEVGGSWLEQADRLAKIINTFVFTANVESSIPMDHIHIAAEDFVLRRRQAGGATGNLTSIWVIAGAVSLATRAVPIVWQQASPAKTFATNERLKLWGLYEAGSEHRKDAWRHIALLANGIVQRT